MNACAINTANFDTLSIHPCIGAFQTPDLALYASFQTGHSDARNAHCNITPPPRTRHHSEVINERWTARVYAGMAAERAR